MYVITVIVFTRRLQYKTWGRARAAGFILNLTNIIYLNNVLGMEIITRQQAITLGLSKYFTGESCRNGHVAPRYVQSSTCQDCIKVSVPAVNIEQRLQLQQQRMALEQSKFDQRAERLALAKRKADLSEKRLALRTSAKRKALVPFRPMLHYADVEFFKSMMFAQSMMSDPTITMDDLLTNKAPEVSGCRAIYHFKVFQVDTPTLREFEQNIDRERRARPDDEDEVRFREKTRQRIEEAAREREELDAPREWSISDISK